MNQFTRVRYTLSASYLRHHVGRNLTVLIMNPQLFVFKKVFTGNNFHL